MTFATATSFAALSIALLSVAAQAQDAPASAQAPQPPPPPSADDGVEDNAIIVIGSRVAGEVETTTPPVKELDEEDVASYGAGSFTELLAALAPETGSGRGRGGGRPVILVNGQRVSSFRELRDYPPEAIRKVEILPEEVALQYGFPPDQRVVNFILKDNYGATTVEVEAGAPTGGGYWANEQSVSLLKLQGKRRFNLSVQLSDQSALTEAERGIIQPAVTGIGVAADPDPGDFRTLVADTKSVQANANWTTPLGRGSLGLNAAAQKDYSSSLFGLNSAVLSGSGTTVTRFFLSPNALARESETATLSAGANFNAPLGDWRLTATADYSHVDARTRTDNRADASALQALVASGALAPTAALPLAALALQPDTVAQSRSDTATSLLTLVGHPVKLPAGEISVTAKAGLDYTALESESTRTLGRTNLDRSDASGGLNVDLPITSRRSGFGDAIGDLSLNFNAGVRELSDFGTLTNWGAGLTWRPTSTLGLQVTYIAKDAAPGLSDLGAPTIVTPNVPIFDFTRGESVLASVTSGGNPDLIKEKQRDWKVGLTWQLPFLEGSNVIAEYFRNRSSDTTNAFPLLTPEIEGAFPGRVVRDASGRLVSIDRRPVTFAEESGSRLRYGLNLSGSFGKADPGAAANSPFAAMRGAGGGGAPRGARAGAPRDGGGMRGGGGGRFGGSGGGDGRGRWNLALYHTYRIDETVRIGTAGPALDLLGGDATGSTPLSRHGIELEGGGFHRGFGVRLSGRYTGRARIDGNALTGTGSLDFAPRATFDLRLFADLGRMQDLVKSAPFLQRSRISLRVDNIFDAQQRVTDATGSVPLSYQPGFLDPRGRFVEIEFRKQF